jgi:hypothetical protein
LSSSYPWQGYHRHPGILVIMIMLPSHAYATLLAKSTADGSISLSTALLHFTSLQVTSGAATLVDSPFRNSTQSRISRGRQPLPSRLRMSVEPNPSRACRDLRFSGCRGVEGGRKGSRVMGRARGVRLSVTCVSAWRVNGRAPYDPLTLASNMTRVLTTSSGVVTADAKPPAMDPQMAASPGVGRRPSR